MLSAEVVPMRRFVTAAAVAAAVIAGASGWASAHIAATVGGFATEVGWLNEPAVQGQMNGLDITVMSSPGAQPVSGLEKTLKAEVSFGGERETLELQPQGNRPGKYTAPIMPSQPGGYKVRLFGTIDGAAFDHTYDLGSDPDMAVVALADVAFPKVAGTSAAQPAAAATPPAQVAPAAPVAPPAAPATPAWPGWAGLGLGAVALVVALWPRGRRA
jgi:hypothetical protein